MPELTREEKLKMIEKLPQRLQDFLYSEDTGAFLLYLGQKYNLPDEKVRLLSKLVADVVLGIVPITSLAQEINSKITSDAQAAMNLAQELNTELLAPVMATPSIPPTPAAPAIPAAPAAPVTPAPTPTPSIPAKPVDEYRELTSSVPEIVDLRKTPPLPILPPTPSEQQNRGSSISQPNPKDLGEIGTAPAPAPAPITPPLTFTRPIEPAKPAPTTPLIEAEPHKIPPSEPRPQYIMRPSGLPPTDLPENVLDLRKDKGEF